MPALLLCLLFILGCSSASPSPDGGGTDLAASNPLVLARPYELQVPSGYDPSKPAPVLVLLHGYGATGPAQSALFLLRPFADQQGILYAYPDGTRDQTGKQFWNATDACCDFGGTKVDDVAYLSAVLDDIQAHYNVDKKRIYVAGHSNGGFMAYRLACDLSERVAAIVSLAGANWKDPARCQPTQRVAALQVHGDVDDSVPYAGGPTEPSARDSALYWARRDGCADKTDVSAPALDLDRSVAGAETQVERWTGCQGGGAELWTMKGVGHVPNFQAAWPAQIWGFLSAHPKP